MKKHAGQMVFRYTAIHITFQFFVAQMRTYGCGQERRDALAIPCEEFVAAIATIAQMPAGSQQVVSAEAAQPEGR
jgi:hypothetical protein